MKKQYTYLSSLLVKVALLQILLAPNTSLSLTPAVRAGAKTAQKAAKTATIAALSPKHGGGCKTRLCQ